jgi:hypothetical protein
MSSTIGGKISKSEKQFSHIVQAELRLTYAVHYKGKEYLAEIDLTRWKITTRHQPEIGFFCWLFGPFKVAKMDRAVYDAFLDQKIEKIFGNIGEALDDRIEKMDRVAPQDVPPADKLN